MSRFGLLILVVLAIGCASDPTAQQVDRMLRSTFEAAGEHFEAGRVPEASVLLHAVEQVDPDYAGAAELRARIGPDTEGYVTGGALGVNRRSRVRVDRPFLLRLLFYPVDRALDVLDIVSLDAHVGLGALANVHATRAVQAGAGFRAKTGVGLHNPRSIGVQVESQAGFSALAFGTEAVSGATFGLPRGVTAGSDSLVGLHRPVTEIYQTYRDYWAIGAQLTLGLVGVDFDVHPVQLLDLVGGFVLIDFARDDPGSTRGLELTSVEREMVQTLRRAEGADTSP